jgi:hypothetical protein
MFESLWPDDLLWAALVGAVIAAALGLLPRSKVRFWLIGLWSALPAALALLFLSFSYPSNPGDALYTLGVLLAFSAIALPPWLIITRLPFNIVRRVRELATNPVS